MGIRGLPFPSSIFAASTATAASKAALIARPAARTADFGALPIWAVADNAYTAVLYACSVSLTFSGTFATHVPELTGQLIDVS